MKSFYFHYNKPASQRTGSPKISVREANEPEDIN